MTKSDNDEANEARLQALKSDISQHRGELGGALEAGGNPASSPSTPKGKYWVPLVLSLGVIFLGAVALYNMLGGKTKVTTVVPTQSTKTTTVTVQPVRLRTFPRTLLVTGSIAAWDELPLGAEVPGLRIERIYVDEGDWVRKGQVLAELNDHVLLAHMKQAQANIGRMRSAIRQQVATLKEAQATQLEADANFRRYSDLLHQGAISQVEAQTRQTSAATTLAKVESARQSIAVAQSDLAKAQAELEQLLVTLAQTRITAPTDGYISKRQAKLGSVITLLGPSVLFNLVRDGRVELNAEVSELDLPSIKPGQQVLVTSDADPGKKYIGRVRQVTPVVNPQTRIGEVHIALPANPELKPGMFMHGELYLGSSPALVVPEAAVLFRDAKPFVFVLKNGVSAVSPIETGTRDQGLVEVLSGLAAGEKVVVAGAGYLKDGSRVRVDTWR